MPSLGCLTRLREFCLLMAQLPHGRGKFASLIAFQIEQRQVARPGHRLDTFGELGDSLCRVNCVPAFRRDLAAAEGSFHARELLVDSLGRVGDQLQGAVGIGQAR